MTSFTLTEKKSIFNNLELTEIMNKKNVFHIINKCDISTEENTKLSKIGKKIKKDRIIVKYKRKIPYGRSFAIKGHSYQNMNKKVRNSLIYKDYIDIDMINAHYYILYQVCKERDVKMPQCKNYIKNRESIIEEYIEKFGKTREEIKDMFISILYFGDYKELIGVEVDYLEELKKEVNGIAYRVLADNEKLKKKIKTLKKGVEYNEVASVFSYFIQDYENTILELIYKYLMNNGFIKDKVATLMFDGIMIQKTDNLPEMNDISKYVLEKCGLGINLKIKEIGDKLIDFDNESKVVIDENMVDKLDLKYMTSLPNYESKKIYFEKFCVKVILPEPNFVLTDFVDKEYYILKSEKIKELLKPVMSGEFDEKGNELSFFQKWTMDVDIKTYRKTDFLPFNPDEEKEFDTGDIFNLFSGYNTDKINTPYDEDKKDKILKPYLDLIYELCGADKEVYEYYLNYMANHIKYPRHKVPVCLIIRSDQGVGKNVSMIPLREIIGDLHYYSSSNVNDFFGNYSEGYYRKLIVNLDELEIKNSLEYENLMKTYISEDKITINAKYIRPFTINNYAISVIFTNKDNAAKIDISTGDRRYVAQKSTTKYLKKPKRFWDSLVRHFKNPVFVSCLYDFFMERGSLDIDLTKNRPITEEYREMYKRFIPSEALFCADLILNKDTLRYEEDDDEDEEEKIDEYIIGRSRLYDRYLEYIQKYNLSSFKPSIKVFMGGMKNKIDEGMEYDLGEDNYTINFNQLRRCLIKKKYIDCDMEEYASFGFDDEFEDYDEDYFDI